MLEKFLKKVGKEKVFSIIIVVATIINIFFVSKEYVMYESFEVDGKTYRYMGTEDNTSRIKCEDGTMYELTETRKVIEDIDDDEMYLNGRYNSDYQLKRDDDKVAKYISTNDYKNTVVMKLFNGKKFIINDKIHSEMLKSAVSISKESGELEYNFKYDKNVPFEYRFIESAIMYHSREKGIMNFKEIIILPFFMTILGVLLFVYPEEMFKLKKKFSDGILEYTIVFMIRAIGVILIAMSISIHMIKF